MVHNRICHDYLKRSRTTQFLLKTAGYPLIRLESIRLGLIYPILCFLRRWKDRSRSTRLQIDASLQLSENGAFSMAHVRGPVINQDGGGRGAVRERFEPRN